MSTPTSDFVDCPTVASRPSDRLPELHRKAASAAILRDSRLVIAVDDDGVVQARIV